MNIQEYISGGIVESYVLGLASKEEAMEFEKLCSQYPELVQARDAFEIALESQAIAGAMEPPADLKAAILSNFAQPRRPAKLVAMRDNRNGGLALRWMAAASVVMFVIAGYFAWQFYNQNKDLKNSNLALQHKLETNDSLMNSMATEQQMMSDPNVTVVSLVGTQKGNPSSANIYWDTTSSNVYMVVKNMPQLPSEKQYQLWALIEGKPVDLGLFDGGNGRVILKMNNTQKADAFAITIENRGNTGIPKGEMEAMKKL